MIPVTQVVTLFSLRTTSLGGPHHSALYTIEILSVDKPSGQQLRVAAPDLTYSVLDIFEGKSD